MTEADLRALLGCLPEKVLERKGQILYSGIETLERSQPDYYFLGFNPAADGTNPTLQSLIRSEFQLCRRNWSAYTAQCWTHEAGKCPSDPCPSAGRKPHQRRVQKIMRELGIRPEETLAANLIFVESEDIKQLKTDPIFDACAQTCWRVHEGIIAAVRPKCIVCLGNGESDSAYSFVRARCKVIREKKSDEKVGSCSAFKAFHGELHLCSAEPFVLTVVGVLHPSYFEPRPGLHAFRHSA